MFKNTFQSGFLSILYSIGSKPLQIWDKKVKGSERRRGRGQARVPSLPGGRGTEWRVVVSSWALEETRRAPLCPVPSPMGLRRRVSARRGYLRGRPGWGISVRAPWCGPSLRRLDLVFPHFIVELIVPVS